MSNFGPGPPIVKKLIIKKPLDFSFQIRIIISVKGNGERKHRGCVQTTDEWGLK